MRDTHLTALAAALLSCALTSTAHAQYNHAAGASAPTVSVRRAMHASDGTITYRDEVARPAADRYGNAAGNQFDLAVDGAFEGQTVAVLHLYTGEGFDFALPRAALREKGFSTYRWSNRPPPPEELRASLAQANQLWVISGAQQLLTDAHLRVIQDFFNAGHGVYIWGDNEPYYADANAVAERLFGGHMDGNLPGDTVVPLRRRTGPGILPNLLLTTGLEQLYEGITIATIRPNDALSPLLYGSANNLVSAYYDHGGRRAILDGGFTRLFLHWDTAGTARYVKNSAAWLANAERFGSAVVAPGVRSGAAPVPMIAPPPVTPPAVRPHAPTLLAPSPHASLTNNRAMPLTHQLGLGVLGAMFLLGLAFGRAPRA